jgi:hypothetical protein
MGKRGAVTSKARATLRRFASAKALKRFMAIHGFASTTARFNAMTCMIGKMPVAR